MYLEYANKFRANCRTLLCTVAVAKFCATLPSDITFQTLLFDTFPGCESMAPMQCGKVAFGVNVDIACPEACGICGDGKVVTALGIQESTPSVQTDDGTLVRTSTETMLHYFLCACRCSRIFSSRDPTSRNPSSPPVPAPLSPHRFSKPARMAASKQSRRLATLRSICWMCSHLVGSDL